MSIDTQSAPIDTAEVEAIRAMQRKFADVVVNAQQLEVMYELYAPDVVIRVPIRRAPLQGAEGYVRIVDAMIQGFPDMTVQLAESAVDRTGDPKFDYVAMACLKARGTHNGELFGVPATGRIATWTTIHMWHVKDGWVVQDHVIADFMSLFQQLGAIRPPTARWRPRM